MSKSRIRGSLSFSAALAVAAGVIVAPVSADESDDKALEDSKAAEQATSDSLSDIEVQLAQLAAEHNDLGNKSADAQAAQIEAEAKLQDALDEAVYANKAADDAAEKVDEAKKDLGQISTVLYRDGAGMIPGAEYLLGGNTFDEATQLSRAYDLIGQDADKRVQEFEALQDVANSMRNEAEAKTKKYQDAANKAKSAADAAAKEEQEAAKRLDEISVQRENLVTQLASQKGTTAQIERDIQDKKEAKAKEEAEAEQQQTISDAEALFTENSDQAPVADATAGATDETVASETQSDTTTAEPAPAATAAPQPTAAATKAPTAAPTTAAPKPAVTPAAPKPAVTPAAPKPAVTPAAPKPAAPKPAAPKPAATTTKPATTTPSTGTASGSAAKIVALAKSYIGIPYVWGGTSPAGWDCIGFVQYVYKLQGVTIDGYHRSSFTPSVGYTVPYSQAKPGDILFWPGHVAISLGGGQNIGAWNPGMGTRIGPDSWIGTPSKVVRVFG